MVELLLLPGRALPPHLHRDWDVVLYVLDGHLTVEAEEMGFQAGPGDLFSLPRGCCTLLETLGLPKRACWPCSAAADSESER